MLNWPRIFKAWIIPQPNVFSQKIRLTTFFDANGSRLFEDRSRLSTLAEVSSSFLWLENVRTRILISKIRPNDIAWAVTTNICSKTSIWLVRVQKICLNFRAKVIIIQFWIAVRMVRNCGISTEIRDKFSHQPFVSIHVIPVIVFARMATITKIEKKPIENSNVSLSSFLLARAI